MKKYFICSDVHSYYSILMRELKDAGFEIDNQDHIFVLVGDLFDRGDESLELYNWVKSLPLERRILIRGNHEYLFRDMVDRGYAESHDEHNCTNETLYQLNSWNDKEKRKEYYKALMTRDGTEASLLRIEESYYGKRRKLFKSEISRKVRDWMMGDEWINYWETPNYIFTHGFIPLSQDIDWETSEALGYIVKRGLPYYREDWRNATATEWEDASWFNWSANFMAIKQGCNKTGKYIVVGHWHTSDLFNYLANTKLDKYNCPIFISNKYKIIGLDACTAGSKKINIAILYENQL